MTAAVAFGWIGCFCFSVCAIPQVYRCWKDGDADGLDLMFLTLWGVGSMDYIVATYLEFGFVVWLHLNYVLNGACLLVIFRYKLFPRGHE